MHCYYAQQELFAQKLLKMQSALCARWVCETASTNDDVKKEIRDCGADLKVALVSDSQSAGRGTRGRKWHSARESLLLTVGVPLDEALEDYSGLTVVLGAACADVLRQFQPAVRLKWPNDIWVNTGKAAGILCELVRSRSRKMHAVTGIGVNICLGEAHVSDVDVPAAALFIATHERSRLNELRAQMAAALSAQIEKACMGFSSASVERLQQRWHELDAFADQRVRLTLPDGEVLEGTVEGIGPRGELVFTDTSGRTTFHADARLRPMPTR